MTRWQRPAIVVLGVYAAVSVTVGAAHALALGQSQDLAPVYMAARLWLHGEDPYRAQSAEEWRHATGALEVPTANVERAYSTPYPPMAVVGLAGISGAEWQTAKTWWLAINLALAVYVPWLIRRLWCGHLGPGPTAALFVVWFGGMGLRVGLANGQHALFWFAAMLSALWLMSTGRAGWAGIPLSLSLHKYPLTAVFLPYFAAGRAWRLLTVAGVATLAWIGVFIMGLRVNTWEVAASYLREIAWWYGRSGPGGLPGRGITDVYPVLTALASEPVATFVLYVIVGVAAVAVWWPLRTGHSSPRAVDVACLVLLMLWGTYHRVYDTIVLIVPLLVLAAHWHGSRAGWPRRVTAAVTLMLAAAWYADPSSLYRRFDAVPLDQIPDSHVFLALSMGYRLIIVAAFAAVVVLRYQPIDTAAPARVVA
jgi:hypothetical protein